MGKEGQKKRWPESLSSIFRKLDVVPGLDQRLSEELLFKCWANAVGSFLKRKTRPSRLSRGVLYIDVESSPLASQLHYMQRELIDKIKLAVPKCNVQSIKCKVGAEIVHDDDETVVSGSTQVISRPVRPQTELKISPDATQALDGVADEQLRESIRRLIIYNKSFS
jgi:hypothetical protein